MTYLEDEIKKNKDNPVALKHMIELLGMELHSCQKENKRLRNLVREAYDEGAADTQSELGDFEGIDVDSMWGKSDTKCHFDEVTK